MHYSFNLHLHKMSLTESKTEKLQQKLEEAEEALQKAAQYGLQLLDDKMDLQNKLEDQRIEWTALIEVSFLNFEYKYKDFNLDAHIFKTA